MQNAKDTFYRMLRNRVAGCNPSRTMVLRGVTRPAVLVAENELMSDAIPTDAFVLRWVSLGVYESGPLPLVAMSCEIRYATDGSSGVVGMDRGRLLAGMDAELAAALATEPKFVSKISYAGVAAGAAPTVMGTNVFWGDVVPGAAVVVGERLERVATIEVFCYQEAGE